MTSLTLYGGVNELGGNKILLEDKGVCLFFDFRQFHKRAVLLEVGKEIRL